MPQAVPQALQLADQPGPPPATYGSLRDAEMASVSDRFRDLSADNFPGRDADGGGGGGGGGNGGGGGGYSGWWRAS